MAAPAAGLAAEPAAAAPRPPGLLLAVEAAPDIDPAGFLVSEKYDGVRAVWDGHTLRTRSGLAIAAPAWFTQRLPAVALDGELWAGRRRFEDLSGAVRRAAPRQAEWQHIRYLAFDLPGVPGPFSARYERLASLGQEVDAPHFQAVEQRRVATRAGLQRWLEAVVAEGGEGLMLHRADALYTTGRSAVLQKLKPEHDAEAVVLAAVPGRGRHAGRMGALRVQTPTGRQFLLGTGFSDAEREAPPPPGSVVSYRHRGYTESGLPRFASFLRVRDPASAAGAGDQSRSAGVSQRGSAP
ncbi:DNA ligase [Rubrivivax rivuli]|uniref:DNA ligase n=2 Tax=Rubrivivax rivuli TaxID=1862385 RepID=A0A437RIY0_9BURK|nr:DNA ligase [Rubrivivax rivuli]